MKAWVSAYLNIDIGAELRRAAAWLESHGNQKKDLIAFSNNWLGSEDRKQQQTNKGNQPGLVDARMVLIPGED